MGFLSGNDQFIAHAADNIPLSLEVRDREWIVSQPAGFKAKRELVL
jgi:hypothetical protein